MISLKPQIFCRDQLSSVPLSMETPKDLACILQASGLDVHGSFVADRVNGDVKDVGLGASLDDLFLDKIDPVVAGHCTMLFDVEHVSYLQTACRWCHWS